MTTSSESSCPLNPVFTNKIPNSLLEQSISVENDFEFDFELCHSTYSGYSGYSGCRN